MKKPFLYSLAAALYIVLLVSVMSLSSSMMPKEDNIFMPMLALSLFVLSALVMAFLFLSEPVKLYLEDQKKEAFSFFTKMIASFACFVIIFLVLVFIF